MILAAAGNRFWRWRPLSSLACSLSWVRLGRSGSDLADMGAPLVVSPLSAVQAERKRVATITARRRDSVPFRGQEAPYTLGAKLSHGVARVNDHPERVVIPSEREE